MYISEFFFLLVQNTMVIVETTLRQVSASPLTSQKAGLKHLLWVHCCIAHSFLLHTANTSAGKVSFSGVCY